MECEGLGVGVEAFNEMLTDREKQAALLGASSPNPAPVPFTVNLDGIRYIPCPVCSTLMNRANFARSSGVIVDLCKGHGTWFDRDELQHIVGFIRAGGLEQSRERDRQDWEAERRRHDAGIGVGRGGSIDSFSLDNRDVDGRINRGSLITSFLADVAIGLAKHLFR